MELRWSVEGDEGVVAVKMDKDFLRVGSEKEGDAVGLREGEVWTKGDLRCGRGRNPPMNPEREVTIPEWMMEEFQEGR